MKDIILEILMGLPGSGKTTYAKKEQESDKKYTSILSLDDAKDRLYYKKDRTIQDCLYEAMKYAVKPQYNRYIVDGLILTNQDIVDVVTYVAERFGKVDIIVHYWNKDRETCVKNDGGRREASSVNTIMNATFETVEWDRLNRIFAEYEATISKIVPHTVELKPDWYRFTRPVAYIDGDNMLRSGKWCTGGASGNCWHDGLSPVSADEPIDFKAFDDLLEKICPTISFLHYKKIRSACVKTEESYESDYYGGGTNHLNWVCDLQKLYEMLNELGYKIKETDGV